MKHTFQFFSYLLFTTLAFSQAYDLEDYYPENNLFKKLKVKSVLDTIASPEFHHMKKEFDTLGRQISWFYVEDSIVTRFRYRKLGDTLIKYHYYATNCVEHAIYQYEIFVYNKQGSIATYSNCHSSYDTENASGCRMHKFFYDEKGRLISKLMYTNENHKQPFSKDLKVADSLLTLENVYSYHYGKKGELRLIKQMMGKPEFRSIDSFYYDKTGRVTKKVFKQNRGYAGEFAVKKPCHVITYQYEKSKQIETSWSTFAGKFGDTISTKKEVNAYIFYPNGLKWMWLYGHEDYPLSAMNYLVYEFYQ